MRYRESFFAKQYARPIQNWANRIDQIERKNFPLSIHESLQLQGYIWLNVELTDLPNTSTNLWTNEQMHDEQATDGVGIRTRHSQMERNQPPFRKASNYEYNRFISAMVETD